MPELGGIEPAVLGLAARKHIRKWASSLQLRVPLPCQWCVETPSLSLLFAMSGFKGRNLFFEYGPSLHKNVPNVPV